MSNFVTQNPQKKAIALFSGGLDSMLAIAVARRAGAQVHAIFIQTGFSSPDLALLERRANAAGASFSAVDIAARYLHEVLSRPRYGFGKAANPCIDCHGYMFATALDLLEEFGADFVISGEVLGQRPMSQRAQALASVKRLAGERANLITRPLSAQLLEPSEPERLGWIDRAKLLDFSGRGRTRQMALAAELGFSDYESPAGGCILTLQAFANKFFDAKNRGELATAADARILQCGRHLRLPDGAKLIISRDERDGEKLLAAAAGCEWLARIDLGASTCGAISFVGQCRAQNSGENGVENGENGAQTATPPGGQMSVTGKKSSAAQNDAKTAPQTAAASRAIVPSSADLSLAVSLAKAYAKGFSSSASINFAGECLQICAPACTREDAQKFLLKG